MRTALSVVLALLITMTTAATADAGRRGEVTRSTHNRWAAADSRGDSQAVTGEATRAERRAADIRRVTVRQGDRAGFVRVKLAGPVDVPAVRDWTVLFWLVARDPEAGDPIVVVHADRQRAESAALYHDSTGQEDTSCETRTAISKDGTVVEARIPPACRWLKVRRVQVTVNVDRYEAGERRAQDYVWAPARLSWRN